MFLKLVEKQTRGIPVGVVDIYGAWCKVDQCDVDNVQQ